MYIHSPDAVAVAFAYEPCIVVLCTVYIIVLYIRVYSYGACRFCELAAKDPPKCPLPECRMHFDGKLFRSRLSPTQEQQLDEAMLGAISVGS